MGAEDLQVQVEMARRFIALIDDDGVEPEREVITRPSRIIREDEACVNGAVDLGHVVDVGK